LNATDDYDPTKPVVSAPGKREEDARMGFMRKALFVGTGGMSGLAVRANSKKERIAKAAEKQARLQKQTLRGGQREAAAAAAQAVSENAAFDVVLSAVDPRRKIATIRAVRAATGMALKETKVVDHPPSVVRTPGVGAANALKASLEELGATAEIRAMVEPARATESDDATPSSVDGSLVGELGRLADLHRSGALSDAEFAAAKDKLLGS